MKYPMKAFLLLFMAVMMTKSGVSATIFYVSPHGSDAWSGRLANPNAKKTDGPFSTLRRARDAARASKKATGERAIRIVAKGGEYFLTEPLELSPEDSGLTLEAAKGEKPILYGGRKLGGWRPDGDRFWTAPLPEAKAGTLDFRLLVVNGSIRPRARLPETGTFMHETTFDVPWMSTTGGGWKRPPTEAELTTMKYKEGDLGPWLSVKNAELTVYHMWDESMVGLSKLDPKTRIVTFSNPSGHPPGAFGVQKYVVWNVREGMKRPGQWYLDRDAGRVVYWPLPGEKMEHATVMIPTMESILSVHGTADAPVENLAIRGLALSITTTPLKSGGFGAGAFDGAVSLWRTKGCRIEDLTIHNVGGQGIKASESSALRIENCDIHDAGACGIMANGADAVVADNLVHHIGVLYPSAIGLFVGGERFQAIHNEVHDTPYTAVNGSGDHGLIEGNLIYRAMRELHDGAGIYATFCKDLTIRGNVIRDIEDTGGYGASAYYLDEQSEGFLVEDNLSVNVARPSHNHMARGNVIRNNVFVTNGDMILTFPRSTGYVFERNALRATGKITFQAAPDGIVRMDDNAIFSGKGETTMETLSDYAASEAKPFVPKEGTLLADPLFLDPKHGDYRFQPNSPALKLGIRPLSFAGAGRRKRR